MDSSKFFKLVVIFCIVSMIQETGARTLRREKKGHYEELNKLAGEMTKHPLKRHMKSHHKINTLLNRLIEIENENWNPSLGDYQHPLRKRHENAGISVERINNNILAELDSSRHESDRKFDVQVREVQNNSSCNYTVSYVKPSGDYILPKNLVNITCKEGGAGCGTDRNACCFQTYTYIQVALRNSKDTHSMRINTGCVCVLQSFSQLKANITQPIIVQ